MALLLSYLLNVTHVTTLLSWRHPAAVWGQMSTGGGHAKQQETMAVLGVPVKSVR